MIVVGEALVDLVEEEDGRFDPRLGGAARNIAIAMARLGVEVRFAGGLGSDRFAAAFRDEFADEGVGLDLAPAIDEPTPLAVVSVAEDGGASYSFHLRGTAATALSESSLMALPRDAPLHLSLGALTLATPAVGDQLRALLRRRADGVALTTMDPNARAAFLGDPASQRLLLAEAAAACAILRCSDEDLELLTCDDGGPAPDSLVRAWLDAGTTAVVVTRGPAGASVTTANVATSVEAPQAEVVDTVGAGDTFGAGMLTALLERDVTTRADVADLDEAAWRDVLGFAARAAAITVSRRGADPPRRAELD